MSEKQPSFKPPKVYEGYWRQSVDEVSDLPWPVPDPAWPSRARFLRALDTLEAVGPSVALAGKSMCRLCGRANGSTEFWLRRWGWPEGYRHYIADHHVRPSEAFERFVLRQVSLADP